MAEEDQELLKQDKLLSNIAVMGTVTETDYETGIGKVRVRIGPDEKSEYFMDWIRRRGGNDWEWWAPEVGEQVLVISPDGDLDRAVIIGCLPYQGKENSITPAELGKRWVKAESKNEKTAHLIQYDDKTSVSYDKEKHLYQVSFLEGKTIDLSIDAAEGKENIDVKVKELNLKIDAADGAEKVTVNVKDKTKLEMDAKGNITITAEGITMKLDQAGTVTMECKKLEVNSSGEVAIKGAMIKLNS